MRRLLMIAAAAALLILGLAPAALAAGPITTSGHGAVISVDGTVDVPAGQSIDAVVVANGTATVEGTVDTIVVLHGTATLTGATTRQLVVVDGTANLGAGTTVTGNVATLRGDVVRSADAVVLGRTTTLEAGVAALGLLLVPIVIVLTVGFGLAMLVAALVVAAFGARQVRTAEDLITHQPGQALVAGVIGAVALPTLGGVLIATIIGAPLGFALLFAVLPLLALVGWLVSAIWVGDWMIARTRGGREAGRPYRAALLGVVVLALAGVLPFVSAIATVFGMGALLLLGWRTLRPGTPAAVPGTTTGWANPVPTAG